MSPKRILNVPCAYLVIALATICLLAACSSPSPTPTPPGSGAPVPTVAAPEETALPTPTVAPSPTLEPTEAVPTPEGSTDPTPVPGQASLVSLREDAVLVGDGWGAQPRKVLSLGPVTSLIVRGSEIAYVANGKILVAGLSGSAPRQVSDAPPAFLLGPDLYWTADGKSLLTIADHEDEDATETGRSLDIGIVSLADGAWRPGLALADCAGVTILQADSADSTVLLVAWGTMPSFAEAQRYSLTTGELVSTLPIAGQGEIIPSPDGRLAVTTLFDEAKGTNVDLLYDLSEDTAPVRQRLGLQADTHTASHVWSPDGQRIAYLLREGRTPTEGGGALGIWIWDTENQKTAKVIEATDPASGPVAWTPDSRYLIYRQVDSAGANAYFALDTADNTARQLPLDPASRILGWLQPEA